MKYFNPSYWFKLWVLSAPIFNDQTIGIDAKSIDNQSDKIWSSKNVTNIDLVNDSLTLSNYNQTMTRYDSLNLVNEKSLTTPTLSTELAVIPYQHHKHRHEKSRNRYKRQQNNEILYKIKSNHYNEYLYAATNRYAYNSNRRTVFTWRGNDWEEYDTNWKLEKQNNQNLYKIKSNHYNEYLYAATNGLAYDSWRRRVFTWRGNDWEEYDTNWKLEKQNEDDCLFKIKSNHYNEYLYAATNRYAYNSNRRTVFTWRGNDWEEYDTNWKLENKNGLFNLQRDFPDYDKNEINLELIDDNNSNDIKNAIKQKYPNLEINGIKIEYKSDYSDFIPGYSTKISISKINEICFYDYHGKLTQNFIYTTKTKLNEISNIITNDPKVKQWISHINDWNSSLPTKIEQLKTYTDSQKWSAKNTEKEIIKSYIRDWSYISTLIENELKLDKLNKNVKGVKTYFENLKNLINNLDEKITKLDSAVTNVENPTNWNCANIATVISGTFGGTALATTSATIPVIGAVGAGVLTIAAGACAIAGV